jgi:hypothetical protein
VAAYGLIKSDYMMKAMHKRIKKHPDNDTKMIKQNPMELLLAIMHSMHEMIHAEYPHVNMMDACSSLINIHQQPEEKQMENIIWFKQIRDILLVAVQVGQDILLFQLVDHYDSMVWKEDNDTEWMEDHAQGRSM